MSRPNVLNHKKGCVWYEMKIDRIDRMIVALQQRRALIVSMMAEHHEKQVVSQKKLNERNRTGEKEVGR